MQRKVFSFLVLLALVAGYLTPLATPALKPQPVQAAGSIIDGIIDDFYGDPIASDSIGDGNGNTNMDLLDLYITDDADYYYIAFTINDDIETTNWGKYALYIDTTNDASGATSDAWGRSVVVSDTHKPEYAIYTYVDSAPYGPEDTQFWQWGGASWSQAGQISAASLSTDGGKSAIEWKISKAALGNADTLWVEVWNTGGGGTDNAQDTINAPADDWNATDWSAQSTLGCSTQYGSPVVDGAVDSVYGDPIASDSTGDGNGNTNMDLLDLYITDDADYYYVAFTINDDIETTNWGKYALYIDTTNDANGATSDAWGRSVVVSDTHKPEYAIYTYVDSAPYGPEDTQFWQWGGASWSQAGQISAASLSTDGGKSAIEWKISKAALGNADTLWVEVWNTGGGGTDNAQDTINAPADDWNATDWSAQSTLGCSTQYGSPVVDGAVDSVYGDPIASDSTGDGNGNTNMDLLDLYITDDADYYYVAFTINDDIETTNWGKYAMYIDTTNDANGATSDAWGRSVVVSDTHKPEYAIYTYVDSAPYGPEDTQFWQWGGASWSQAGQISAASLSTDGGKSAIEWKISKAALGNADTLWVEVWNTGGGGTDNAQDTINAPADDWNATDWSAQSTLECSTPVGAHKYPQAQEGASQDDTVWWTELGHNSRDEQYRTPFGAVTTGVTVTLRLRAANHDLTGAKVRIWDDRQNTQTIMDMQRVAADDVYEWWEAKLPVGDEPTIYWYRFIAIDGTDTDYYEDDSGRTGGWGQAFDESQDNAWQLTVYDPDYQTPDWVKNAVIYQIFPDRFRNGDDTNDTSSGTFFYDEAGGTIYQSDTTNWNTVICDPRDAEGCPNMWSQNFYGGDLQGIVDKLDYLDDLGVTALYLNPVFESPSNHKYDTTDFSIIDDNFGDLSTFITLTTEAHNRGIHVILDGVFNHTSSDSIYFDRYGRYDSVGACESVDSPYRSWYYFEDVDPGEGECVGSDGTPNGATYESWFGYDSLPKLRANDTAVRELIWSEGTDSIAPYWMQWADGWRLDVAGDVDPGKTNEDPSDLNSYWEGFRDAVRAENPETYIVGEEWGNSTPWLLGEEWDASMNYQFGTAIMGFWRDETFTDNDHNSGSSAGTIPPLTPSQLDERLHYLEERYPPESFYAMMNLLGSHDTNRALFMLDHNTDLNDRSIYEDPNYDWSDAIERLKGVVLLQFTLPGAPTVYYGDEVGLVGPPAYAGDKWEDDPYNRMPYPWLDESGTPYYTHLQTQNGQDALKDYYKLLTGARNTHPALRTGSFDTQLVDDENGIYIFGRKWISGTVSDAALVIANQGDQQDVTVDLSGYLPAGTQLEDVLDNNEMYTTTTTGELVVTGVPTMSGAVLVLANGLAAPPEAVTDLAVTEEGSHELTLEWSAATDADAYIVYRSQVSNGGYTAISTTTALSYTDTGLDNATWYYYVVVSKDNDTLLTSGNSNEASGMPHDTIGWANLEGPDEITHTLGITPTGLITGQVYIDGVTSGGGAGEGVLAQLGYGPATTEPVSWTLWVDAMYFGEIGNNDVYSATLQPETVGEYHYVYRYSTTAGREWVYADRSGMVAPDTATHPGVLHVEASADTTPPAAPQNPMAIHWGVGHITIQWQPVSDADLYAYDIYREGGETRAPLAKIARVMAPTTIYTDDTVMNNQTYTYTVYALDQAFNKSAASSIVVAKAEPRLVETRFIVTVPGFTPAGDTIYIAGNDTSAFVASFNPEKQPMTPMGNNTWCYTVDVADGTALQYKYTRGSWDMVENWGPITGYTNREMTVEYGSTGVMTMTDTVHNWRDPLVLETYPLAHATNWDTDQPVTALLNRTLDTTKITSATFVVEEIGVGAVAGELGFTHPALQYVDPTYGTLNVTGTLVTFTPTVALSTANGYQVALEREGYVDEGQMQKDYSWAFGILLPELTVEKSVTPTTGVQPGDMVTYTLVIENHGAGNAAGVVLTDGLPSLLQFDSWVNQGSAMLPLPGNTITWGPYDVPANTEYTLSFRAILTETQLASQVITNTAEYDSENAGSGLAPAAFAVQGTVPEPNLVLTKAVVPDADIEAGAIVTYTITLENTGTATAAGIQLTDTLPLSVTFGSFVTGTNVTPVYSSGAITWTGDLATGVQPLAIIFTATVGSGVPGATVTNEVSITADNTAGDTASATFTYLGYNKIFLPVVMRSN